jgi:hypothetical protein
VSEDHVGSLRLLRMLRTLLQEAELPATFRFHLTGRWFPDGEEILTPMMDATILTTSLFASPNLVDLTLSCTTITEINRAQASLTLRSLNFLGNVHTSPEAMLAISKSCPRLVELTASVYEIDEEYEGKPVVLESSSLEKLTLLAVPATELVIKAPSLAHLVCSSENFAPDCVKVWSPSPESLQLLDMNPFWAATLHVKLSHPLNLQNLSIWEPTAELTEKTGTTVLETISQPLLKLSQNLRVLKLTSSSTFDGVRLPYD